MYICLHKVNRKILQRMEALAITGALPQASRIEIGANLLWINCCVSKE